MKLSYLPVNAAFAFTMGTSLIRLEGEEMFYRTKKEAKAAAERHGLRVDAKGTVRAHGPNPFAQRRDR